MKILRPQEVAEKLSVSRQTIWRFTKKIPDFPKPIKIGPGTTGFIESEVDEFIRARQLTSSNNNME